MKSRSIPILLTLAATMAVATACQNSPTVLPGNPGGPQPTMPQKPNAASSNEGGFSIKDYPIIDQTYILNDVPILESFAFNGTFPYARYGMPGEASSTLADLQASVLYHFTNRLIFSDYKT
ncbi:MAG: hypothetical protein ACAI44_05920, partial [Candidatus Sericytochromatia bacterium]